MYLKSCYNEERVWSGTLQRWWNSVGESKDFGRFLSKKSTAKNAKNLDGRSSEQELTLEKQLLFLVGMSYCASCMV